MNRILVVDNELATLRQIALLLNPPYETLLAKSGAMALEIGRLTKPDLILLALEMPRMDGFETLAAMKNDPLLREIPVILLLPGLDSAIESRGFEIGARDYIIKPVQRAILRRRVALHLQLFRYQSDLENTLQELEDSIADSFLQLVTYKGDHVNSHTRSTSGFVRILTDELLAQGTFAPELTPETATLFVRAARFHDIGMIGVSDIILRKPGKLMPEEYAEIQNHTLIGGRVMAGIAERLPEETYFQYAQTLAEGHHERYDGSGYPRGLSGDAIPLCCRIVSVANVYDACLTTRIYRPALTQKEAWDVIIRGAGTEFDPRVVAAFERTQEQCIEYLSNRGEGGRDDSR
jgi:putative two-component system response regulator